MENEKYTEKVSVNVNASTLSAIDLLVDNGYYSNRGDFNGVFNIDGEVDREMLYACISSIKVRGKAIAPDDIKKHYGLK